MKTFSKRKRLTAQAREFVGLSPNFQIRQSGKGWPFALELMAFGLSVIGTRRDEA